MRARNFAHVISIKFECSIGDWFVLYQMSKNMNKRFFAEFIALLSLKINPDPYLSADPEIDILKRSDDEEGPNGDSGVGKDDNIAVSMKANLILQTLLGASRCIRKSKRPGKPNRTPSVSVKTGRRTLFCAFVVVFFVNHKIASLPLTLFEAQSFPNCTGLFWLHIVVHFSFPFSTQ